MTHLEEAVEHWKNGGLAARTNTLLTLALWFAIGAFLTTVVMSYFNSEAGPWASLAGGALGSIFAVLLKRF